MLVRFGGWRLILTVVGIAALAGAFAIVFGSASRRDAIVVARQQAERRATLEAGTLIADVGKFRVLPYVLTELPDVRGALVDRSPTAVARLDATLRALTQQTGATVFYAIDRDGTARSASNAGDSDSFVGYDFRFRPYFLEAMRRGDSEYFAQGSVTGRPGLFLARRAGPAAAPAGVIVVKIEFDRIERLWRSAAQMSLVVDRDGVIVIGTQPDLRFRTIAPLAPDRRRALEASRQYGDRKLHDAGLRFADDGSARDAGGLRYLVIEQRLPVLGWRHFHLEPLQPILAAADFRTRVATLILTLVLTGLAALIGWSGLRRRRIEAAREQLETEVAKRTVELTDAYDRLQRESDERARADSRYRAAREELAQANRLGSIGTITTSVAHEVNQPLTAIRTASENSLKLLARGRIEQVAENLSLIVGLTQRIGAITGELLSYARRGRGAPKQVPLDEILDGALMLVGDSFRRAGVTLDIDRGPGLPPIRVGRIRIEQVLVNLLTNALDAVADTPGGRVRLLASTDGDHIRLSVEDNGPGVAPDMVETVFQPFFTGKRGGTGLGLGISREIVADHGGTLSVARSALGGAAFVVNLPRDGKEPL
ncbi:ATP-binding protein [Sphingomonas floccifaciens]|uniref:histidine kinase n=2 Tax=Sphingomonas floccifaciens TaxID=1844115 RepID=A0ABW4NFL3_9SPHN